MGFELTGRFARPTVFKMSRVPLQKAVSAFWGTVCGTVGRSKYASTSPTASSSLSGIKSRLNDETMKHGSTDQQERWRSLRGPLVQPLALAMDDAFTLLNEVACDRLSKGKRSYQARAWLSAAGPASRAARLHLSASRRSRRRRLPGAQLASEHAAGGAVEGRAAGPARRGDERSSCRACGCDGR